MGVVYSGTELTEGLIPGEGQHLDAALSVMERVTELEPVDFTMVHGSVPEGRSNVRSDLDVLVLYHHDEPADEPVVVDAIKAELEEIGAKTNVKLEPNIWPAEESPLARSERLYDMLFSWHLVKSMDSPDWAIGQPDQAIITIAQATHELEVVRRVAINYSIYKHGGFTKAPRLFDEGDKSCFSAMQRGLELPKSAGRKLQQMMSVLGQSENIPYLELLAASPDNEQTRLALVDLLQIDREYTELIEFCLAELANLTETDVAEYRAWLADRYPRVMRLGVVAATGLTNFAVNL